MAVCFIGTTGGFQGIGMISFVCSFEVCRSENRRSKSLDRLSDIAVMYVLGAALLVAFSHVGRLLAHVVAMTWSLVAFT